MEVSLGSLKHHLLASLSWLGGQEQPPTMTPSPLACPSILTSEAFRWPHQLQLRTFQPLQFVQSSRQCPAHSWWCPAHPTHILLAQAPGSCSAPLALPTGTSDTHMPCPVPHHGGGRDTWGHNFRVMVKAWVVPGMARVGGLEMREKFQLEACCTDLGGDVQVSPLPSCSLNLGSSQDLKAPSFHQKFLG